MIIMTMAKMGEAMKVCRSLSAKCLKWLKQIFFYYCMFYDFFKVRVYISSGGAH